jgi:hypothetical protein
MIFLQSFSIFQITDTINEVLAKQEVYYKPNIKLYVKEDFNYLTAWQFVAKN